MDDLDIIRLHGSAFHGHRLQANRVKGSIIYKDNFIAVPLVEWCERNFITIDTGRSLLKHRLLLGYRRHGIWYVASNPSCKSELLEYLRVDQLFFDADND